MKKIDTSALGIQQGSCMLFSDFINDGPMWAGHGDRRASKLIVFPEPFAQVPAVHATIGLWDMDHKHNIRADLTVGEVTTTGFEVTFTTWADTRIARVRVDWLAIGGVESDENWQLY